MRKKSKWYLQCVCMCVCGGGGKGKKKLPNGVT